MNEWIPICVTDPPKDGWTPSCTQTECDEHFASDDCPANELLPAGEYYTEDAPLVPGSMEDWLDTLMFLTGVGSKPLGFVHPPSTLPEKREK